MMVLTWRNAPKVRQNMFNSHEISYQEHCNWFSRIQNDDCCFWYIYIDEQGTPNGVISFTDYNRLWRNAFWGFYTGTQAPIGTGLKMEYEAIEHAFNELDLNKLNCEVLGFNTGVVTMHKQFGFKQEGIFRENYYDGTTYHDVIRLSLLRREWEKKKIRFL